MSLQGNGMVVTGGNSGIGEAIVRAAAAEGASVVLDDVAHPEETDDLVAKVQAAGGQAVGVHADVSKPADLHAMLAQAVEAYGRLDVLINNAGVETRTSLLDTSQADFAKVVATNRNGPFFGTKLAAPQSPPTAGCCPLAPPPAALTAHARAPAPARPLRSEVNSTRRTRGRGG